MRSFLIDLGNSNDGPIGMVMRVIARDKAEAVETARQVLRMVSGDCGEVALRVPAEFMEAVEYISVYLNPNVITEMDVGDDESIQEVHE